MLTNQKTLALFLVLSLWSFPGQSQALLLGANLALQVPRTDNNIAELDGSPGLGWEFGPALAFKAKSHFFAKMEGVLGAEYREERVVVGAGQELARVRSTYVALQPLAGFWLGRAEWPLSFFAGLGPGARLPIKSLVLLGGQRHEVDERPKLQGKMEAGLFYDLPGGFTASGALWFGRYDLRDGLLDNASYTRLAGLTLNFSYRW